MALSSCQVALILLQFEWWCTIHSKSRFSCAIWSAPSSRVNSCLSEAAVLRQEHAGSFFGARGLEEGSSGWSLPHRPGQCPAGCVPLLPLGFPPARQLCLTACQKIQGTSFQRLKMKGTRRGRQFKCFK